ncbi:MAG: hypothetical protein ACPHGU_05035 [Candidatus Thalassarchaeaceae archaeon]
MTDNESPWWDSSKEQSSPNPEISSKNVFSGDVSNFSNLQTVSAPQTQDPNQFLISHFLIGLFLVPTIAAFFMSLMILWIEPGGVDDNWYYDSRYQPSFDDNYITINNEEYNTMTVDFYIPSVRDLDLYDIYDRDYYFYTSVNVWGEDWEDYGYCGFDIEWLGLSVQSDDNRIWYPMDCDGSLEGYSFYFLKNGQSITYATDYDSQIDNADVSGDIDPDLDGILIDFLPFIIPIAYLGMIIWSFVKKKKSLGLGLIGGIFVAPFSFCFIMFLSVLFWDL